MLTLAPPPLPPAVDGLLRAIDARDPAAAGASRQALRSDAERLRPMLIEAYIQDPQCVATQLALAMVCLAADRVAEARFHLLRSVPGQPERFACVGGLHHFCWHPEAPAALLRAATAMQFAGAEQDAKAMLRLLRETLETVRIAAVTRDFPRHVLWTRPDVLRQVRGVVQVGANVGDECPCWAALGLPALLAFEPVPTAFAQLTTSLARHAPRGASWRALPLAVADRVGTLAFWQGEQSGNSSFLELNPDRSEFHQQNRHSHRIEVETTTLDAFFDAHPGLLDDHNLIFMDVQGTEHLVIEGAERILDRIDFVCMELSETEIYAGSWTVDRMDALMARHGFAKIADEPNGWPEQRDAVYAREGFGAAR